MFNTRKGVAVVDYQICERGFSSITYSLVSSFHFSDWSIGFVVVADWLIGFEGIGFAVKVVFAGIGFAVKVVFAGIGFAVKVVFAGIGFAVKSVFGGIGFAVKSVFGVKCVFCTINDRERKNVFFGLFSSGGCDIALIILSTAEHNVNATMDNERTLMTILKNDGPSVHAGDVGCLTRIHGQNSRIQPRVIDATHAGLSIQVDPLTLLIFDDQAVVGPTRTQTQPQLSCRRHQHVMKILQLLDVKEIDFFSLNVVIVGPVDLGDVGVQIRPLSSGFKVNDDLLLHDFKLIKQLHVSVQLLSDQIVIEGSHADSKRIIIFIRGDRFLSALKKPNQNRAVKRTNNTTPKGRPKNSTTASPKTTG